MNCLHPEDQIIIVSDDFKEWAITKNETIFYCKKCRKFTFVHALGSSLWTTLDDLISHIRTMRSFAVYYGSEIYPDQFLTEKALSQKSDVLQFIDQYDDCEPQMYDTDIPLVVDQK